MRQWPWCLGIEKSFRQLEYLGDAMRIVRIAGPSTQAWTCMNSNRAGLACHSWVDAGYIRHRGPLLSSGVQGCDWLSCRPADGAGETAMA